MQECAAISRKLTWPWTNAGARAGAVSKRVREHAPSASQSMEDARLMGRKWGLKCSQGTACQPILVFLIGPLRRMQSFHPFSSWMAQSGCLFVPEGTLSLLCTKAHYLLAVVLRVIRRGGRRQEYLFDIQRDGFRKISDCWEFSLDNGSTLRQQAAFLNCPLFHLLASIHMTCSLYADIYSS